MSMLAGLDFPQAARVTRVIHPRRGQNWGPGREPSSVRGRADESLAAEIQAANERHPWNGEAMQETRTAGQETGAGS